MDFSQITDALYIGTTPRREDYSLLYSLGVRLVINMRIEYRPDPLPNPGAGSLQVLWLPTFDSPLIPIPMRALQRGAVEALATIEGGGKVYAHCAAGVHRGVVMGAAILIAQGYSPEEAMRLIKAHRETADPYAWYIRRRIMRFAELWDHRDPPYLEKW